MKKALLAFVTCFLIQPLWAQEEVAPGFSSDRPGQTYASSVMAKGSLLWQQGFEWRDYYSGGGELPIVVNQRLLSSQTAFRYGLGYNLELGLSYDHIGSNFPLLNNEFEWEGQDPRLMLRYGLPSANSFFSWAFIVQSSFSNLDYRLSASLQDGPWGVSGNLGFYHSEDESFSANWTVLLGYSQDWYSFFAEVYGLSLNSANRDFLAFDAGIAFLINPDFQWEVFAGNQIGIGPAVGVFNDYFLNTGFSWRLR